jgi:hypothetical protein
MMRSVDFDSDCVPGAESAEIPDRKLLDYALDPDHEVGGPKAASLKRLVCESGL